MKNKMSDVRNHLIAMLELLGEELPSKETTELAIERAKATALIAGKYIESVKCEIDARRLLAESGQNLPSVLESPPTNAPPLRAIGNGRHA